MIKILMHGCNGKMGQVISRLVEAETDMEIVAGIDAWDDGHNPYPVYADIKDCSVQADCVIDFSAALAVDALLDYCVDKKLACVLCTTGLSQEQLEKAQKASESVALLRSANMSLGINLLLRMVKDAAEVLAGAGFDMEIVEKHHNQKVDAPSGTALALADSLNRALNGEYEYVYDRSTRREKRNPKEIGISAVRGGTIVGDHDVIFAGEDEVITFSHTAYSKAVFARGAISAARIMSFRPAGYYDMSDVIEAVLSCGNGK